MSFRDELCGGALRPVVSLPAAACRAALALAAGVLALCPVEARACSCAQPFANELRVGDGKIPSNAAGVTWWFPSIASTDPVESLVTLERWDGQQLRPVSAVVQPSSGGAYLIGPAAPWSEGERYRISVDAGLDAFAEQRFRTVEFEVTGPLEADALTLTLTPLSLEIRQTLSLIDSGGSCAAQHDVGFVDVAASSKVVYPKDLLFFQTYVDGQPWHPSEALCAAIEPGTSWVGRGSDRIVADCSGHTLPGIALAPGAHQVRMEARLPGTDVVFSTDEKWVALFCKGSSDGAPSAASTGGTPISEAPSVAVPAMDGDAEDVPHAAGSGCALSSLSNSVQRHGALASLALAMLGVRRWRGGARGSVARRAHSGVGR